MNIFSEGTLVTVRGTFTNSSGTAHNPTEVALYAREPSGTEVTYWFGSGTITRPSTGTYEANLNTTSKRGLWVYDYYSTGAGQSDGGEKGFWVE